MQISSAQVFAFVEGGLDRTFTEKILNACGLEHNQFRVFAIKEVNNGTGGKQAVLQHFQKFRRQGHLSTNAWGKKLISLFFVDKDADDFLGKRLRSPHLVYTPTYDIEGVLFHFCNMLKALAEACLITTSQASDLLGDAKLWIKSIAKNWADWITLCLISQKSRKNTGFTFDRPSCINPDPLQPPIEDKLTDCKILTADVLGMTLNEFDTYYHTIQSIESDGCLKYFKGKWLKSIIQTTIDSAPRIEDSNKKAIGDKMSVALLAQVAASENCNCLKYYQPLLAGVLNNIK